MCQRGRLGYPAQQGILIRYITAHITNNGIDINIYICIHVVLLVSNALCTKSLVIRRGGFSLHNIFVIIKQNKCKGEELHI